MIEKLPTGPNTFDINSVREFYKPLNLEVKPFHFTKVSENSISEFLCNLSIKLSTVPDECKIAKLKPLGKKTDPKSYRQISLLPFISKILEKVIHDQTVEFVTKKNILYKFQSGFRKFHSTDSCLSYLQDKVAKGFDLG